MRDLLIITPTRARPGNAERLAAAVAETCTAETDLMFAIDHDDDSYNVARLGIAKVIQARRRTCPEWSNHLALTYGRDYRAIASLGDDHLPRTHGWDTTMLAALDEMGGTGIVYGDDIGQGEDLPTAPVMSSDIPAALGWWFLPTAKHLFCDNVWLNLGTAAGCLRYLPEVVIEHLHHSRGCAPRDESYERSGAHWAHDQAAYLAWRRDGFEADAAKIRALRAVSADVR